MEDNKMEINDFRGISIRGLAAYGICCLENTLLHFDLHNDEGWQFLLGRFWLYTSLPEFLGKGSDSYYSKDIKDIESLSCFLNDINFERVMREVECRKYPKEDSISVVDKEIITLLYQTYEKTNEIVLEITDAVYDVAFTECNGWSDYPTYITLYEVEKLLKIMQDNNLPLPELERFQKFRLDFDPTKNISIKYEAKAWGAPFNGKEELSKI